MEWFSVWLPLVSQLVVPVSLLAWLAFGRRAIKARSIAVAAIVATYVMAIGIAGLWLVLQARSMRKGKAAYHLAA